MASLQYYATLADQRSFLVDLLAEMTELRVFESYSAYDSELREFTSAEAILQDLQCVPHGMLYLRVLLVPSIPMQIERFDLAPSTGGSFRHRIDGFGLAQLSLGREDARGIRLSYFGHFEQTTAENRAPGSAMQNLLPLPDDWALLAKRSRRLRYKLRKLATCKTGGWLLLPEADRASRGGFPLYKQMSNVTEVRRL